MSDWPVVSLREVTTKIGSGSTPRGGKSVYRNSGVSFIRSQNVYDNHFESEGIARIGDAAAEQLNNVEVLEGDVLVCITGESVTRTSMVDPSALPARVSQHVAIVRADPAKLDPLFLQSSLLNPIVKSRMNTLSQAGATRRALTKKHLQGLQIELPPLEEQRRIAGVLRVFDELIETESKLAGSLSTLSDALGQDFLGSLGPTTGETQVQDVAEITKGYSYKSSELVEGSGWLVGLKTVGRDGTFKTDGVKALTADPRQAQLVDTGDLVVAQTDLTQARAVIGRAVRVRRGTLTGKLVASLDLAVVRPKTNATPEYLEAVLRSTNFREHVLGFCNGTTVLHMGAAAIPSFPVTIPDRDQMIRFSERVRVLREGCDQALDSADELRRTRDELLPLLMSGAIRVSDVEDSVP